MICVVGGSGFIGTRLCRRLSVKKSEFLVVDKRKGSEFPSLTETADVTDTESLRRAVPEKSVIVNLAAEHHDNVSPVTLYDDVNVGGAENICAVAREKKINHIVFTSSVAVYGFAPPETDESGEINYFNDYGRTKWFAEKVYRKWQAEEPASRTLVIIRPTVVFGENNRGNVYNLLKQISGGKFIMPGNGKNRKSMAYVENVAAFIEHAITFRPGLHLYNYIDKPDLDMNQLVSLVKKVLGRSSGKISLRLPYAAGFAAGLLFDALSFVTGKKFTVSSIRVKKFCAETQFATSAGKSGFKPPFELEDALIKTIRYEFIDNNSGDELFYSE
ncbi:MAG: NAD-dependent epimerase/dehydratase family protein [Spirochaetia bacterium]|nr:NAD-dependent epimerase/dehydratase family protein [Spirochaetia bacterium]